MKADVVEIRGDGRDPGNLHSEQSSQQPGITRLRCPPLLLAWGQVRQSTLGLALKGCLHSREFSAIAKGLPRRISILDLQGRIYISHINLFGSVKQCPTYQSSNFREGSRIYVYVIFITNDETTLDQIWRFSGEDFSFVPTRHFPSLIDACC